MEEMQDNFKEIEDTFNNLVDIRLKARGNRDNSTLEKTEEEFKIATRAYLDAVHKKNAGEKVSAEDMDSIRRSLAKGEK